MHSAKLRQAKRPEYVVETAKLSDVDIASTFFALCKGINSPHSLAAWLCYKYDHAALVDLTIDPANYGDSRLAFLGTHATPQAFAYDLQVTEFLSKYKGLSLKVDTKDKAFCTFKSTEERLVSVNASLRKISRSPQSARLEAIISIARRKISEVLGLRAEADFNFGWGPGATFSIKGDVAWDIKILEKRISVTAACLPLAQTAIGADLHWCRARGIPADGPCTLLAGEFKVVPGNRITNVPKNAKTDRTIAVEPTANIYLQKGVGAWIRRRLRKICRINLDDQTVNQKFAGRLEYATIDLKAASDSISREIVRLLFPEEWTFLLGCLRSPGYYLDKQWQLYEKWSSMGNGYTFELETLIFWALSTATLLVDSDKAHVLVYGDDILVPVEHAEATIETLQAFGFETNTKKTHYQYLYRESCGAHFYDGNLVTPVYQKEVLNHVEELYHMANRLRHFATRLGGYHYSDSTVRNAWCTAVRLLGAKFSYTPLYLTTGTVDHVNLSLQGSLHMSIEDCESFGLPLLAYGTEQWFIGFVPKKRRFDQAAGLCYSLQSEASFEGSDLVALRGRGKVRWRKKRCRLSFRSNVWL